MDKIKYKSLILGFVSLGIFMLFTGAGLAMGDAATTVSAEAPRMAPAAVTLELYDNFHTLGVIATLDAGDDPDNDATTTLEYRRSGASEYQTGFPLTRVSNTRFAGSIF